MEQNETVANDRKLYRDYLIVVKGENQMEYTKFDILKIHTQNTMLLWKDVYGIAPNSSAKKLYEAMLEWQTELTNTLKLWIDKGLSMTVGELILARANLGAVVEFWLKLFYCIHYEDYCKKPIRTKKKKMIEPEKATFKELNKFSTGILWDSIVSDEFLWVDTVRDKRNALHSFEYKNIGTPQDFLDDIDYLYKFVDDIISRLPPIEDYIESYPEGYILLPIFI